MSLRCPTGFAVLCLFLVASAAEDPTKATACHDCEETEVDTMGVHLLQRDRSLQLPVKKRSMEILPLELPSPVTWMHVPRTGSTFAYTLLELPQVCDSRWSKPELEYIGNIPPARYEVQNHCPGWHAPSGCPERVSFLECTEANIGRDWAFREGKVVGFFRRPEVRLMSDYNFDVNYVGRPDMLSLADFVVAGQGCVTKMLTWGVEYAHNCAYSGGLPTDEQMELAQARVETGFSFIGMTDQWDLSICLFNTMFGVKCHSSQFKEYSQHETSSNSSDLTLLNGFVDKYDTPLWVIAQRKFAENLDRYGMKDELCVPCVD